MLPLRLRRRALKRWSQQGRPPIEFRSCVWMEVRPAVISGHLPCPDELLRVGPCIGAAASNLYTLFELEDDQFAVGGICGLQLVDRALHLANAALGPLQFAALRVAAVPWLATSPPPAALRPLEIRASDALDFA